MLSVICLLVRPVYAQQESVDAKQRADLLVAAEPMQVGQEFCKALMTGDKALAVALREAAAVAGLSASLGDIPADGGRSEQAFQALRSDQKVLVLDSLAVLAAGEGLPALEALEGVVTGFPDDPGSYRQVVAAARSLEALTKSAPSPGRSVDVLQLVMRESEPLRTAGFFRLHARLVGSGAEAAKELAELYSRQSAEAEDLLRRSGRAREGSKGVSLESPAPALVLRGPQAVAVVELGYSGEDSHEVVGDYIVGAGHILRMAAGARVVFQAGARLLVRDGGRVLVEGDPEDANGWVRFSAARKKGDFTGLQIEQAGIAELTGLLVDGAERAVHARAAKSLSISNCVFRECGRGSALPVGISAVALDTCREAAVTIKNCLFEGSRGPSLGLRYVHVDVDACTIRGGGSDAVRGSYFVFLRLEDSKIEGNFGHAVHIEDRSSVSAVRCSFLNDHKDFEVFLSKTPDASTFESCWWGPASLRAARDIADGKPANLPRLHDGRDAKDGESAVALIPGKPADKAICEKAGCQGLQVPR